MGLDDLFGGIKNAVGEGAADKLEGVKDLFDDGFDFSEITEGLSKIKDYLIDNPNDENDSLLDKIKLAVEELKDKNSLKALEILKTCSGKISDVAEKAGVGAIGETISKMLSK